MHIETGFSQAMEHHLFRAMFEERKRVFVDLLRWNVPVVAGRYEVDQFDDDRAIYIVITGDDGDHRASARLLPTTHDHILGTIFPNLCKEAPPRGAAILEITRFCLARKLRARERLEVRNQLVTALVEYALGNHIRSYTGVAEWPWFQQILSFGWHCLPLGLPATDQGRCLVALQIDIDGSTREQLRASGVFRPVGVADLASAA
ncbi:MAG: autoinducer synthase [Alphaproteobacteria bacterium]|nr:autoinducer synthase [Alphaproteobacteria bacterium]MBU0831027.1 autoinducer synthase [Alphaproteobacteria bacterium]MBU1768765.1 autoinducer synthase [Alphaproteobacteria bacterium]